MSALTFANLLHDIFDVDVPVGVIVSPASDLASIAAYVEEQRAGGTKRPTYDAVHGRDATEVHARDLTLDKFLDEATLAAAPSLPGPSPRGAHRAADRSHRLPRPLPGAAVAGADGPGRRQGHRPGPRQGRRRRPGPGWTRRSTAAIRSCWRTTASWPTSTSRCSPATRARRISAWRDADWQRLADTVDLIVDPAALVNHVLPYSQLFGPNAVGTAELIRIALTTRIKPFVYVSTIGVGDGIDAGHASSRRPTSGR